MSNQDSPQGKPEGGDDELSLPAPSVHEVEVTLTVKVTITDPDVVARCVENHNDQHVPMPPGGKGADRGWRDFFYDITTERDVVRHLAYNCAVNHYHDVSDLDGWADLPKGAATMSIMNADVE